MESIVGQQKIQTNLIEKSVEVLNITISHANTTLKNHFVKITVSIMWSITTLKQVL